tara:strand:+ start:444 stop:722 length:279 start_codon:yes stop_codon:yes gene_type:complete
MDDKEPPPDDKRVSSSQGGRTEKDFLIGLAKRNKNPNNGGYRQTQLIYEIIEARKRDMQRVEELNRQGDNGNGSHGNGRLGFFRRIYHRVLG